MIIISWYSGHGANMGKKSNAGAGSVPSHVALIPDGNRRWSGLHKFALFRGYDNGVKKFIDFSIWAKGFGIKTLTVWALSTENIKSRSRVELGALYGLYVRTATDPKILEKLRSNGAKVKVIGNLGMLPTRVAKALRHLEKRTEAYKDFTINLLVGYGGRDDLLYAFRGLDRTAGSAGSMDEDFVRQHIRTASVPDVDLIIRTSGEMRLSGFLPWQSDYSELYFAKKYWPDFERKDLVKALKVFAQRQRRFGK
jgi:undecaprenyl diphosphate synthase